MNVVEKAALMQRLAAVRKEAVDRSSTEVTLRFNDLVLAITEIENSQKWANFNILKAPWWAKTYWLGVLFFSLSVYVSYGTAVMFAVAASGAMLAITSYGLYTWVRWANDWNKPNDRRY